MKRALGFLASSLVAGLLIVLPVYLSILLLLKAMSSMAGLVQPIAALLPERFPGEAAVSLVLLLIVSLLIGAAVRTVAGQALRDWIERSFFQRIPGYELLRSLTQQLAGKSEETAWQPALVEIEEALVLGFIIEEHEDGRYTVFVPSVPTPLAGAAYVLSPDRVHPLDVPFTQAIKSVSRWGLGSKELVAAMKERDQR